MSDAARYRDLLRTAGAAARAAADLLAGAVAADVRAKGTPRDLVTEWDLRSEETIRRVLAEREPGIPVLGEEGGLGGGAGAGGGGGAAGGLRWIVDPIDGTVNFAHGLPLWSISIGLEELGAGPGALIAGVVAAPALGWWFEAVRGGGARDGTGAPLRVSRTPRLAEAMLGTGFPYDLATAPDNNLAEWGHLYRHAGTCRRLGSTSLDLCFVARGWYDGFWERKVKAWDLAAGALIAREAGATVTDTRGGPFDPHAGEVAASNGAIHEELVAELGRVHRAEGESDGGP